MPHYTSVTAFAPATVANVGCGYDIMGFAINAIGDKATVTLRDENDPVIALTGQYAHLIPAERHKNTSGAAVDAYLAATGQTHIKLSIALEKNMPLGSGMGSSASSAAAAVFAVNYMLGSPLTTAQLVPFAMEGERIACGAAHADNAAPSLMGGFTLIRSYQPLDVIAVPCPQELYCAVVHPHLELHTSDARRILKKDATIGDAIKQSANTAGFMVALLQSDYELLGRSMQDLLAEPKRTQLIPNFDAIKSAALEKGALGCGISGSGPSLFALCRGEETAKAVSQAIQKGFADAGLDSEGYVSALNAEGCRIVNYSISE